MAARYSAMAADCAWHAKTTSLQVGTVAVAFFGRAIREDPLHDLEE